jgi:hypothetical protein
VGRKAGTHCDAKYFSFFSQTHTRNIDRHSHEILILAHETARHYPRMIAPTPQQQIP